CNQQPASEASGFRSTPAHPVWANCWRYRWYALWQLRCYFSPRSWESPVEAGVFEQTSTLGAAGVLATLRLLGGLVDVRDVEPVDGTSCDSNRVQFSPPHKKPRKHPCTRRVFGSSTLRLAE